MSTTHYTACTASLIQVWIEHNWCASPLLNIVVYHHTGYAYNEQMYSFDEEILHALVQELMHKSDIKHGQVVQLCFISETQSLLFFCQWACSVSVCLSYFRLELFSMWKRVYRFSPKLELEWTSALLGLMKGGIKTPQNNFQIYRPISSIYIASHF